jgi:hypothetical protein
VNTPSFYKRGQYQPLEGEVSGRIMEISWSKLEEGESPAVCLVRELQEEMNIEISLNEFY